MFSSICVIVVDVRSKPKPDHSLTLPRLLIGEHEREFTGPEKSLKLCKSEKNRKRAGFLGKNSKGL